MKNNYILSLLLIAVGLLSWSCEEKDNISPEGNWELSSPQATLSASTFVLDESTPNETITFTWDEANSSAGYQVFYTIVLDSGGSESFDSPILSLSATNNGKGTSASISHAALDEALSKAGFPANSIANVTLAVKATSLSKSSFDIVALSITRFATEIIPTSLYLSGNATEKGTDLSQSIPLRRLNKADGSPANQYEIYTQLTAGNTFKLFSNQQLPAHQYGGQAGDLVKSGNAISVAEDGIYRISVDLDNQVYSLLKIDKWSVVGSPIAGGWGGDEPLEYQGNGLWQGSINLVGTGGFVFRANGDWAYLIKRVKGTSNELIMEAQAASQGLEFEDIPSDQLGTFIFTLDLSANAYTYAIDEDPNAVGPITTPNRLFLLADGLSIHEFAKDGDTFNSAHYLALQSGVTYTLNAAEDGSGTSYSFDTTIGATNTPDGDKVSDTGTLRESSATLTVDRDQLYQLQLNFETSQLTWTYYNMKLFHWSDWDTRDEFLMSYQHPNTFTLTTALVGGNDMKFISPWDHDFGAENPTALSGNMINKGGSNLINITTDGTYIVSIIISDDYQSGTYNFSN